MMLRPGKLRAALLAELLGTVRHTDERVLLGPGIGRDAAVIDVGGGRVLVAKADPVTFAAERIGWYVVNVNANDVACLGARPAWFMATALLPEGAPEELARTVFSEITSACDALGVELVGGHTETTIGLDRPLVCGAMLGEAARDEIVMGRDVRAGDRVLLTKGIAIEGTALLARESPGLLAAAGVPQDAIARAAAMLYEPGISVVPEASALCAAVRPRLMHDPTEGGLSTALYELAEAAGVTLRLDPAAVRVFDETRIVCEALRLDEMGLLASGALLAVVAAEDCERAHAALAEMKIEDVAIATVEAGPARVIMGLEGPITPLPRFARDEIARLYENMQERDTGEQRSPEGL